MANLVLTPKGRDSQPTPNVHSTPAVTLGPSGMSLSHIAPSASMGWLDARQEKSRRSAQELPFPAMSMGEDWRRTDPARLGIPAAITKGRGALGTTTHPLAPGDCLVAIVTADGVELTGPEDELAHFTTSGCRVVDAHTLDDPQLVEPLLNLLNDSTYLSQLWQGTWDNGIAVIIPSGVVMSTPLWVCHGASPSGLSIQTTLISLGEASSATVIDYLDGVSTTPEDVALSLSGTAISVGANASLTYGLVQNLDPLAAHVDWRRATLGNSAQIHMAPVVVGSHTHKGYFDVVLEGRGAHATVTGWCAPGEGQQIDQQTLQRHVGSDTMSRLTIKGAVAGAGTSVYSGLISVGPLAQRTDAYVTNRHLLLDEGAVADSVPRLEIEANDVMCGHAAAAGHVDDDQRFYLLSRGIPQRVADRLIIRGFFDDVIHAIPDASLRSVANTLLNERIIQWGGDDTDFLDSLADDDVLASAHGDKSEASV